MKSIYPLTVFILVALDKVHHSHRPQFRCEEEHEERRPVVKIALEVNMERSTALAPAFAYPMTASSHADCSTTAVDDTKISLKTA